VNLIKNAEIEDLDQLLPLFQDYRKFYRKPSDPKEKEFLHDRIKNKDSIILLSIEKNKVVGFAQLYFSYSSLGLGKSVILNDLFVLPEFRRKKIAWNLIDKSIQVARDFRAINISISTEISNTSAQDLYKKFGFKKDNDFFYFNFKI
jgi:ribosomal protein S18 acetylase RimI-like enzyme